MNHAAAHFAHPLLRVPTPAGWIAQAGALPDVLLIDHANCEKKAASTALALMFAYAEDLELTGKMSRLAREELRHYEQVAKLIRSLKMTPQRLAIIKALLTSAASVLPEQAAEIAKFNDSLKKLIADAKPVYELGEAAPGVVHGRSLKADELDQMARAAKLGEDLDAESRQLTAAMTAFNDKLLAAAYKVDGRKIGIIKVLLGGCDGLKVSGHRTFSRRHSVCIRNRGLRKPLYAE